MSGRSIGLSVNARVVCGSPCRRFRSSDGSADSSSEPSSTGSMCPFEGPPFSSTDSMGLVLALPKSCKFRQDKQPTVCVAR
jgi:hypothetical protein